MPRAIATAASVQLQPGQIAVQPGQPLRRRKAARFSDKSDLTHLRQGLLQFLRRCAILAAATRKEAAAVRESATKKVIAESLKRRMLRHNLTDITVTDLCTDAEINRRTFYRHFTDKYQLVTWIYENGFQKAIGDDEPGLFDLFGRVCTYLYADRAFYARALTFTGQNSFRDFLCGRLHPYLQKDFSDLFSNPQTEAFMSGKMSNVVIDIVQNWLEQPDCPPPEEFAPWALNLWRSIMGRWKDLGDAWEHTIDHKNA